MSIQLGTFDDREVVKTSISVTNAGDGLSDALAVDPQLMHLGEKVYVVLECEVAKVRFAEIKDANVVVREHVLRAGNATIVDGAMVREALASQKDRITRAKEAAEGVSRLPTPEELGSQHDLGQHAEGLVPGCPQCDGETVAVAAEASEASVASISDRKGRRTGG